MKIFLLEDDYALNKIIKSSLESKGFLVESVLDGYQAATSILNTKCDLYILDLNVMGFDGHDILTLIRQKDIVTPVIMISSEIGIESLKKSYDLGCNEYIKKPFEFEELMLRITYHSHTFLGQKNTENIIHLGQNLYFDSDKLSLLKGDFEIDLTQKEKLLLALLVKHINTSVDLETIHQYVWDGKMIEMVSMRTIVHKLNKKLRNGMIVNIRGIGYKLIHTSAQY